MIFVVPPKLVPLAEQMFPGAKVIANKPLPAPPAPCKRPGRQ